MKRIFTHTLQLALTYALTLTTHTVYAQGSNHALDFNGNDFWQAQASGSLNFGSNSVTIEFWVQRNGLGYRQDCINKKRLQASGLSQNDLGIFFTAGNQVTGFFRGNTATTDIVTSTSTISDNNWHHIALVRNSATATIDLFIDGILESTVTSNNLDVTSNGPMRVGSNRPESTIPTVAGALHYDGAMDEVRVWNTALTQTEIRENMCQKLTGTEPNLVAYYRMDEGLDNSCSGGEDVCDLTSNGNHGTKF